MNSSKQSLLKMKRSDKKSALYTVELLKADAHAVALRGSVETRLHQVFRLSVRLIGIVWLIDVIVGFVTRLVRLLLIRLIRVSGLLIIGLIRLIGLFIIRLIIICGRRVGFIGLRALLFDLSSWRRWLTGLNFLRLW